MTIADKRRVIEVLLCCASDPDNVYGGTTTQAASTIVFGREIPAANSAWLECAKEHQRKDIDVTHGQVAIAAAYRLIESSPTLVREWFGKAGAS